MKKLFGILILTLMIIFQSCSKDEELQIGKASSESLSFKFTKQEAEKYYEENIHQRLNSRSFDENGNYNPYYDLAWSLGFYPSYYNGEVLVVPLKDRELLSQEYVDAHMLFFEDSLDNIQNRLIVFVIDSVHYATNNIECNVNNFTGVNFQVDNEGAAGIFCQFQNGLLTSYSDTLSATVGNSNEILSEIRRKGPKCPTFGRGWWDRFWGGVGGFFESIGDFFGDLFSGNGSGGFGNGSGFGNNSGFGGFGIGAEGNGDHGGTSTGEGGGGGTGTPNINLNTYFSELQIKHLNKATKRLNEYFHWDLEILDYLKGIDVDCLEEIAALPEQGITDALENLECLDIETISKIPCIGFAENFISEYGLQLTVNELENLVGDFYGNCGAQEDFNEFVFSSLGGIKVNVTEDNDVVTDVDAFITTYSCQSFYLTSTGANKYKTTISNLLLLFNETKLFPPGLKTYTFSISFDIEVTALPGEQPCEIKNQLAASLNKAVNDVVSIFGWDRVYKKYNASDIIERDLEIALEKELIKHFPVYARADVPASNFLGGNPPVPAIPGEVDNCCN